MPKPLIAIVSPFIDKRHGTERTVAECVQRLAADFDIRVYSNRVEDVDLSRITWRRVPALPGPHLFAYCWWFCANYFWRLADRWFHGIRPAAVFSPGINCLDADAILVHVVFGRFRERMRQQLTLRRSPLKTWPQLIHRRIYYALIAMLERRIYPRVAVPVTAVSQKTANDLAHFYGRTQNVRIAYIGLDFERFSPARRAELRAGARSTLGISEDQFVLLLVGNDWKSKGLPCVLEAAAQVETMPLQILVAGNDNPAPFAAQIDRLGLGGRVRFMASRADIEFYYAAADVYASPTLEDAFALPPAEAMACGLPIITSRNNGGAEILTNGKDGFILDDASDARALAAILLRLWDDPAYRCAISGQAVHTARELNWDKTAACIGRMWLDAMHEHHPNDLH